MDRVEFREVLQDSIIRLSKRLLSGWRKPSSAQVDSFRQLLAEYRQLELAPEYTALQRLEGELQGALTRLSQIEDVIQLRRVRPPEQRGAAPRIA